MKKWLIGIIALIFAIVTGASAGVVLNSASVFAGVKVDGENLGGMSRGEMENWLRSKAAAAAKKKLTFYYQDIKYSVDPQQIEYSFDAAGTAEAVWRYGREGSWWHRIKSIYSARVHGYEVPVSIHYSEERLNKLLAQWAGKIDRPPKNASLSLETGKIIPEQIGRRVDIEQNKEQLLRMLREKSAQSPICVQEVSPRISASDIEKSGVKDLLGIYTTYFNSNDINRTTNIRLAAEKINGILLQPGEVFSYNDIVGPRDIQYGFKEAMEIVDGELVPGIGGGVCQASSTLYNAVLFAGLQIVERTNHSKPLSYVPLGRDATVAYGSLDFKFANNFPVPVMILAEVQGNQLKMGVFGKDTSGETVQIAVINQREIPQGITERPDPTLKAGEKKVEEPGSPGYEVTALRIWQRNGKEVRREVLSTDQYLPTNTIVRVGGKSLNDPLNLPPAATTMAPVRQEPGKKGADGEKLPGKMKEEKVREQTRN